MNNIRGNRSKIIGVLDDYSGISKEELDGIFESIDWSNGEDFTVMNTCSILKMENLKLLKVR